MSVTEHATIGRGSSAIEWTNATWNPVTGCSKVSPGCAHCYAETITARFAGRPGYIAEHRPWTPENAEHNVRLHPERLEQPLRWRKPRMVFVNSMSDLFHELVPDAFVDDVFAAIASARQHVFQILTKRPERAQEWFESRVSTFNTRDRVLTLAHNHGAAPTIADWPLPNAWIGVSIENARYTYRADVLREIPAAVRFISAEPLLGSLLDARRPDARDDGLVDVDDMDSLRTISEQRGKKPLDLTGIDWLIVGGESGGRMARPMHPQWARELRDACVEIQDARRAVGAFKEPAFFFKQWGSHDERGIYRGASPKSGGRSLDGLTWDEMPDPKPEPTKEAA